MPYQVLARKWRPQSFDAVVGQPAVTRTLQNAITGGRVHHAFVFAGPRGVGKTTTARILARALNCVKGPTVEPCGTCEPCLEIAEGRDIDVLEIDAATHTQVDTVREVIISGLAIVPVRDRHKIFIIDEVHQLSAASFNALLKSIEEPPPHVVFMMATTEIGKIPETVLSRAQVFEFHTIPSRQIAAHLRAIADAEGITVPDEALTLIARAAEGSMRDAQSAFDQVIAFAGDTIALDDVTTVLGLVGRDVLFEIATIVADEDAPKAFELTARIVEHGYDLRLVCRELSRLVRDLLVVSVDPGRVEDPEIAAETERDTLRALAARFSREDLLRAFDVLGRAEYEVRTSAQPRYSLEMALLRWIHLRKLVPLTDLIAQLEQGGGGRALASAGAAPASSSPSHASSSSSASSANRPGAGRANPGPSRASASAPAARSRPAPAPASPPVAERAAPAPASGGDEAEGDLKARILNQVRRGRTVLYNTVIAQAQRIELDGDRLVFAYAPAHRSLREKLEQSRAWLQEVATTVAGHKVAVVALQQDEPEAGGSATRAQAVAGPDAPDGPSEPPVDEEQGPPGPPDPENGQPPRAGKGSGDLRAEALADAAVQAMLDVFPAEIRDVEEM